ncbi:MAG: B12-binding domain-containing radical SAM protein [Elusimicrobia bacterium]|nr:B12-binding domain-containing radical SAM protein [Elusimicrobiota bacterium]
MSAPLRVSILTVPVEPHYMDLMPKAVSGTDVFSIRSEGRIPVPPKIAPVSIIKWMEKHGYPREHTDFYDIDMELPSDERLARYFREFRPDVVGLSAVVSTCYYQVKRIAKILREVCPDAWIVLGGSLSASANLILRKSDCDVCIVGDGEIAWVEFLDYVKVHGRTRDYAALSRIQGLAYLDPAGELQSTGYGRAIPAEDMPFPDFDILQSGLKDRPDDLRYYLRVGLNTHEFQTDKRAHAPGRRPNLINLWSSKGCVARCTFCQRSTKGYRVPALDAFDAHLAHVKERFDVGYIHILDENFGSDREYAYGVARLMQKHGMLWMASGVRVSSIERADVSYFVEHGCCSLKFGVETGSQKIMNVMEKKFTVERVFETLKHCADHDIVSPLAVMMGMPGETCETAQTTGAFIGRIAHMQGIEPEYLGMSIFYALPLTGTPLYIYGQKLGLIGTTPEEEEDYLLSVSGTGASKVNYTNLNGAPLRDVVFWDWLVKLESTRTFLELSAKAPIDKTKFMYKVIHDESNFTRRAEAVGRPLTAWEVVSRMRQGVPTGIKAKLFYWLDNFLEDKVVYNPTLHKLPRWLLYGAVQNAVYAAFLLQRIVAKAAGRRFNLYQPRPAVPTLDLAAKPGEVRIGMSLRTVVKELQAADKAPKSATERNRDLLAIGL